MIETNTRPSDSRFAGFFLIALSFFCVICSVYCALNPSGIRDRIDPQARISDKSLIDIYFLVFFVVLVVAGIVLGWVGLKIILKKRNITL